MSVSPRPAPERQERADRGAAWCERPPGRDRSYERKMVFFCFVALVAILVLAALCVPQRPHSPGGDGQLEKSTAAAGE